MQLRLVETYDVQHDETRYVVQRKSGFFDHWRTVNSYGNQEMAQKLFDRFKKAQGEYWHRKTLEEWTHSA
jgi:hypothetical protein